jgi:dienelactone hydrolase
MKSIPSILTTMLMLSSAAFGADQIPWDLPRLWQAPRAQPAEGFATNNLRAVFFEGLPHTGQPTRVFAYIGMPEHKPGEKVPAMVLVHGGGGTAFVKWVELWNRRGYAAIAMDTCGCVPRGSYGKWQRHAQGGPAGWGGFTQVDAAEQDQWSFHAVAAVVLAHSLLRAQPEVDTTRIGITGISWGGYLTCIAAGVDDRYKLAAPVYGCGFLGDNSTWLPEFQKMGAEKASTWLRRWDPSRYLPRAKMPFLWVDGSNDFAYPMDSLQKSYRLPTGPRTLCTRVRMPHGHGAPGENPEEIRAFADHILKGGPALARITAQGRDWATYASPAPIVKAELNYTKDSGVWKQRKWETIPATLDAAQHKFSAEIPAGTTVHYFNIVDEHGLVVSTEHVEIAPPVPSSSSSSSSSHR